MKRAKLPYEVKFKGGDLSKEQFYLLSFNGEEALNEFYSFKLKIVSDKSIELKKFLETKNRNILFTMNVDGTSRYIHGICLEASIENMINSLYIYEITICSSLAALSIGKTSKIFLNMTIEDSFSSILKEHQFSNGIDYEFLLNPKQYDSSKQNYEEIDYLCQYNESSYRFIQRYSAEFGLRFYFEQDEDNSKMIFTDYNGTFNPLKNEFLEFVPTLNYQTDSFGAVSSLKNIQKRVPLKSLYLNNDLRYEHINLEVDGKIDDMEESNTPEEVHFGGTPFLQKNQSRYQAIEDNRIKSESNLVILQTNNHQMAPGYTFKVKKHFHLKETQPLVILKVNHKGNQLSYLKNLRSEMSKSLLGYKLSKDYNLYENKVEAIDATIEYRVPKLQDNGLIMGTIIGKIKGSKGSEQAFRSKDGSYQVQMPFDTVSHEELSSCWIHTLGDSQGKGIQMSLNDGDDVMIGFLEGDPNRPYILGSINQKGTIMEENTQLKIQAKGYTMMIGSKAKELFEQNKHIVEGS